MKISCIVISDNNNYFQELADKLASDVSLAVFKHADGIA